MITNNDVSPTGFDELLASRYSCRAFTPEPVPVEVLKAVMRSAQHTASWCNAQSWSVDLTGPETTAKLSQALVDEVRSSPAGGSDIAPPREYEGAYLERRRGSGFALYGALGIAKEDKVARGKQMMRHYSFFGAQHVAVISSPEALGPYGYVDCGGFIANVMNAARARGLATIAQAAVVLRPNAVRSVLNISEDQHLVCAISIGYADENDPANSFRTDRADFDETVTVYP